MSAPTSKRNWPDYLGMVNLLVFAVALPIYSFYAAIQSVTWFTGTQPGERQAQLTWFIVGLASTGVAVVLAGISAIAGQRPARVLAGITIPLAVLGFIFFGLVTKGAADSLPDAPPPVAEPAGPSCGPDSHPAVFGGDTRYQPCAEHREQAEALLPQILAGLPVDAVTPATVDAAAAELAEAGIVEGFDMALAYDNGDLVAAWSVAPVTCVMAVWHGGAWQLTVDGLLVDGGCVYRAS